MDPGYSLKNENPFRKANIFSKLLFTWMIRLFYQCKQKGLQIIDLYRVLENDKSDKLGDILERHWDEEYHNAKLNGKVPSLLKCMFKSFGLNYMMWGMVMFVQLMGRAFQPILLSYYIKLFSRADTEDVEKEMVIYGTGLVLISATTVLLNHHGNFRFSLTGMRCRIAVSSLVYRKITRLNQVSLGNIASGQVVNLLSNDVSRFDLVVIGLHAVWISPFLVATISYFLWQEVGESCLAGILVLAMLSLPLQSYLGKLTGRIRMRIAKKTDHRVRIMSEIISGIQVIKMYGWEKPFEKVVHNARFTEISDITTTSYYRGIFSSSLLLLQRITLFSTIACFIILGNQITSDKVFSMAQFFSILQLALAVYLPMSFSYGAEALTSVRRLRDFLMMEEKEVTPIRSLNESSVQVNGVSANWTPNTPTLEDINLKIPPGILCAIVGPVGSGKSSLLQLLLGELTVTSGEISIGGDLSYASQEPWLFASSVRNNILFGQPFDKTWYETVVKVCALVKDFQQFPHGDRTLVGDRGVSLSGGQKARINLARSIYRKADIYIMDDPLSAVDTHVGRYLFDECICKHLRRKTRILVTHQLQYLKKAHLIIVMNKGQIQSMGTFDELAQSKLDFTQLLTSADETNEKPDEVKDASRYERKRTLSMGSTEVESIELLQDNSTISENQEESGGDPNVSSFKEYLKATNSICMVFTVCMLFLLTQMFASSADLWVTFWTNQEEIRNEEQLSKANQTEMNFIEQNIMYNNETLYDYLSIDGVIYHILKTDVALSIYGLIIIFGIFITLTRSFAFFNMTMMSSKNLHARMFHCLLKSPMRFFNTNPSGRILNRFSKDIGGIDEILPRVLLDAIQISLAITGILVNVAISNVYAIGAIIICGGMFWVIRGWYISSARIIKHLEGVTKSPVFSHLSSTLHGIPTIRASNAESILISEFDSHQNTHTAAWFLTISCMVSFGLWLDIICVIFIASVTYSFIILQNFTDVYGSFVGLALSQAMILTGVLQQGMRQIAEVINQLTSVERVLQYTKLETEGPFVTPRESGLKKNWPTKGRIVFKRLSLRYIETDPPVLKSLTFVIEEGEKVGIVGRTGAGKTSLISALFRLAYLDGRIIIDGIDTNAVGLTDLRKKISIIPQEPVLFSASLRYNLDPFEEYDDAQIWRALEEVELREVVPSLNFMVMEGGSNFSLGQRQLICLARAILRNNKILVLDEATANVDLRTDSFIQTTIREKFKNCTVITVAHRLNTIMDSDRVLVMSFGSVVEFDHPHKLLQNEEGTFTKMVGETGPSMSQQLKDIALQAYKDKSDSIDA